MIRPAAAVLAFGLVLSNAAVAQDHPDFAIENVTVLPMTGPGARIEGATVVVADGRIVDVTPTAATILPAEIERIDGSEKFLLPAFTDMHMHMVSEPIPDLPYGPEEFLLPYIAHGVMQVVDLGASTDTVALARAVEAGDLRAPHIMTGRMVDADPPERPYNASPISTEEEARALVHDIKAQGYDFVKTYSRLTRPLFNALVDEAGKAGIRVVGHVPLGDSRDPAVALVPGFAMLSHAEEMAKGPRTDEAIATYVALAKEHGIVLASTLFTNQQIAAQAADPAMLADVEGVEHVNPLELFLWFEENGYVRDATPERVQRFEEVSDFAIRAAKAFHDAGIPVFPGTDSIISGVVAGYSLHEEFKALSRAGLPNEDIILAATSGATAWLGIGDDRGTVEPGKRANLVLLDADPIADIANTRAIAAVIVEGEVLTRAELDAMTAELAALYEPLRILFSPGAAAALAD